MSIEYKSFKKCLGFVCKIKLGNKLEKILNCVHVHFQFVRFPTNLDLYPALDPFFISCKRYFYWHFCFSNS
jgi:hypothetical protein